MRMLLAVLTLVSSTAMADYLTKDSGEVCAIPDGFNTAPYDTTFNLKGMAEDCEFPHEAAIAAFFTAIENLQETGLEHPICQDGLVFGPAIQEYPCYELIED